MLELPFADGSFDAVLEKGALEVRRCLCVRMR